MSWSPFGGSSRENESLIDSCDCCRSLSYKERIYGFLICAGIGIFLEFLSLGSFVGVMTGSPTRFAILYSLGNVVALTGTGFLVGPKKQFKNMSDPTRLITSIVFVAALILTLVAAFW
eukprot:CAMPEP_0115017920 /NCGR_PEP_ID=MMETSP0216-20121206/28446_1 /TAXON_ID=223996 /ORGANISM="Protocruzia adherens, Strain Boccale" /LENGTH=117 /DNA_ID=CAMNT_0002388913 /DNA_START=37 /DNA_END=387 /DNA_ORIENTATION=-